MLVNCYYCGFGAVHSIEFNNKDGNIWQSGIINQRLPENITCRYTFETVTFYLLAEYLRKFLAKYPQTKKITLFTALDTNTVNNIIKDPRNESEQYLSELYQGKKLVFDNRGDSIIFQNAKDVSYAYFKLKKENKEVKFTNGGGDDLFADCFGNIYNVY